MNGVQFHGITPYLYYEDLEAMVDWLERVFGFRLIATHADGTGVLINAELSVGDQEIWLDGYPGYWEERSPPDQWIGIWVDSADRMHQRVLAAGESCDEPVDRPHRVRELRVHDPQGYVWGFLERLP